MEVFVYSVHWWYDTFDGSSGKMLTSTGVIAAESMSNAVEKLTTEAYENVEWVKIYSVEQGDCGYADINDINAVVTAQALTSDE